ncbi:S8 family serine peptidase [Halobacteriovorax sp. HFRX-2_2]|uniref:S8 family serine peptidase n=1 Tax=unclassified Halobacteriovorax TaxID=2639665 RepID=UPI00371407B8
MKIIPFFISLVSVTNILATESCTLDGNVKTCIDGTKKSISKYFEKNNKISSEEFFLNNRMIKQNFYTIEGEQISRVTYEYKSDSTFYKTVFNTQNNHVQSKVLIQKIGEQEIVLKEYGFDKRTHILENIDTISDDLIVERKVINPDGEDFKYKFIYDDKRIIGFDVFNNNDVKIGDYIQNEIGEVAGGPRDATVKIAVIDSGFDHNHQDIQDHILINSIESFNKEDNDGDGFVDNILGVHFDGDSDIKFMNPFSGFLPRTGGASSQKAGIYGIPFETIKAKGTTGPITSHGTHVSSIALKGLKSASLLAFAGDFGESKYLDMISKKLQNSEVDFVNMSFSFPHQSLGLVDRKTYRSLQNMFLNNPNVVFFVAAGNDGRFLNGSRDCMYPACYSYPNVVAIGATTDSEWRRDENYEMADFSNYSSNYVDFFAPGTKVEAALLGDMKIRHSGTSMASPMALNMAAHLKEQNPNMSALEIVDLMKKQSIKKNSIESKFGVIRPLPTVLR